MSSAGSAALAVRDLRVEYGTGRSRLVAVDGVSLIVPRHGSTGLVGESGSGKSTLARAVVGLLPTTGGSIALAGEQTSDRSRRRPAYRRRVQMVFQDPYSSLNPRMTIREAIDEACAVARGGSRRSRDERVEDLLAKVGIPTSALAHYPHQLSGGQRQRVAIARALAVEPEVIVLDEVTSALDVSVQASILNLLQDLQAEFGLSYLFISHDLSVVRVMSDVVAVMCVGQRVEFAGAEALFAEPEHPYTCALVESVPRVGTDVPNAAFSGDLPDPRNPPAGCRFHTRCPIGPLADSERRICVDEDPIRISESRVHEAACHFAAAASADRDTPPVATSLEDVGRIDE